MNLSVGIVGLPNVGKSTLFNALLKKQQALAANYPFATIDPNVGVVPVPDVRLLKLAEVVRDEEKLSFVPPLVPATVKFVDIAGLVKGAASGEGLGNKFLSHIREVSVVAHVVRVFEDANIVKEGAVDPESDYEVIRAELALADLDAVVRKMKDKPSPTVKIPAAKQKEILENLHAALSEGREFEMDLISDEQEFLDSINLLTLKPEIIVLNVGEGEYSQENVEAITSKYAEMLHIPASKFIVICAQIESELASLTEDEQVEYLLDLGLESSGLTRLIQKAYSELGLISFLTAGEKEVRAWTIRRGMFAPQAAAVIHTDFEKHFIKADIVTFDDFVTLGGWKKAREEGKVRSEGREYEMSEGDVVEFKIGR